MRPESPEVALARAVRPAVSVRDVTKTFDRRFVRGGYTTFKTQLLQPFRRGKYKEELARSKIEVLKGLSFDIMPGETVGIIGRNGAGKSSLLKLLTGIYKPTSGTISKNGRISALLELGAGFHPEFSGRENIFMNGMILGLSKKELKRREQEIIDFSELGDFIDAPVRTYSSGMYMRLAFSIAVNVDPDILIIDEVLAVGDEHFQHKSKTKLDEFKKKSTAIILVTHDLGTVEQWCSRAIWLDEGRIGADGEPRAVIGAYRTRVNEAESGNYLAQEAGAGSSGGVAAQEHEQPSESRVVEGQELAPSTDSAEPELAPEPPKRWGDRRVEITSLRLLDGRGVDRRVFAAGEPLTVEIDYRARLRVEEANIGIGFLAPSGAWLFGTNVKLDDRECPTLEGEGRIRCVVQSNTLVARGIRVDVAIVGPKDEAYDFWTFAAQIDSVGPLVGRLGSNHLELEWTLDGVALEEKRGSAA
jgi:lipopolysaccharide transport system ATP-binding protein